jgi:hypothetical protein
MAQLITPNSGILNVEGVLQQNGEPVLTRDEFFIRGFKIKAQTSLPKGKVIAAAGYDNTAQLVTGVVLSNLGQTILGITSEPVEANKTTILISKGIISTNLNGASRNLGDPVYVTASGNLSFGIESKRVGMLLTTTPNATVLIDIKKKSSLGYVGNAITRPNFDNSTYFATTQYVNNMFESVNNTFKAYNLGKFWSQVSVPAPSFSTLGYANGAFVGLQGSQARISVDRGFTWTSVPAPNSEWRSLAYGNGVFVAVSPFSPHVIRSEDGGYTWNTISVPASYWTSVTYGNGIFVAVSSNSPYVMTSTNGSSWTPFPPPNSIASAWQSVTYGNGVFVAVSTNSPYVMTSTNGSNWTQTLQPVPASAWYSVTYGNGAFVAVSTGPHYVIRSENNGSSWTSVSSPTSHWIRVTYGNGVFVAISPNLPYVMISKDGGLTWTPASAPGSSWAAIAYGNGLFIASSSNPPYIMRST